MVHAITIIHAAVDRCELCGSGAQAVVCGCCGAWPAGGVAGTAVGTLHPPCIPHRLLLFPSNRYNELCGGLYNGKSVERTQVRG